MPAGIQLQESEKKSTKSQEDENEIFDLNLSDWLETDPEKSDNK